MPPTPAPPEHRRKSNITVLLIITTALIGGWFVMWGSGLFDQLGRGVSLLVLVADVAVLAILWSVLLRKDLNRRR